MIVYDLICAAGGHGFEGWFASGDAFAEQKAGGLLSCPVCGDSDVSKAVMAPNVGAKGNQARSAPPAAHDETHAASAPDTDAAPDQLSLQNVPEITMQMRDMIGKLAKAQGKMLEGSKWVGSDFASRARDMHYGEAEPELIHGQSSEEEAQDLIDEGISVAPLPLPVVPPEAKN